MDIHAAIAKQQEARQTLKSSLGEVSKKSPSHMKPETRSKRRSNKRDLAEQTILESIQRIKAARRAGPKAWDAAYNSSITQLELFLSEIKAKEWRVTEL